MASGVACIVGRRPRRLGYPHELAQLADDAEGAWVHAYLHRKEGDLANAAYWYRRAGRPVAHGDLAAEWRAISEALLTREG